MIKKFELRPARRAGTPYKPAAQGREIVAPPSISSTLLPMAADVVWASEFTFICFRSSFVYLCTVVDVFTGEVLEFNISRPHDSKFVLLAIKRAAERTGAVPERFHSD